MINQDADDFKAMLEATMSIYSVECNVNVLRLWWASLAKHDFNLVKESFSRHIQDTKNGKFAPKPADILAIIETLKPDGRIGADEAWALYPHDEYSSAVITDEMAEAMSSAQPLLNEGDKIGARMAFKEAYNRIVNRNKTSNLHPKWFASLGHDLNSREIAIKQAVTLGRLTNEQAIKLLPVTYHSKITQAVGEIKFLSVNKFNESEKQLAHEKLEKIKLMLKGESND